VFIENIKHLKGLKNYSAPFINMNILSMHPYTPHLLADITAAHRTEISEEKFSQTI